MPKEKNKLMIIILTIVAVILIVGGWLFFRLLGGEDSELTEIYKLQSDLGVIKMRNLVEENLNFFSPSGNQVGLWEKLDASKQYENLIDAKEITFDLVNFGNPYPFAQPELPEEED